MPNMTISVSKELYTYMKKHRDIRWSAVARWAMEDYAKKLDILDELLKNSEMTIEDAIKLGAKMNKGIAKRHHL